MKFDVQGDDKKAMLAVQSLRNTLMAASLAATVAILVELALAALTNNTYNASRSFHSAFLEPQSGNGGRIFALKFGSTSFFLLASFFCSALGLGFLIDANFLVSANEEFSFPAYTQMVFEQGFILAFIGNRILCMSFPLLLWMFGPLPVALGSVALVWGLYVRDFVGKFSRSDTMHSLTWKRKPYLLWTKKKINEFGFTSSYVLAFGFGLEKICLFL